MTIKITEQQVIDGLRRAVQEKGDDYVYRGYCVYFDTDTKDAPPDCILGHVFHYAGYGLPDLDHKNGENPMNMNTLQIERLLTYGVVECDTERAKRLMCQAQDRQDSTTRETPWSEIVKEVFYWEEVK